jgi:hypothetical protein
MKSLQCILLAACSSSVLPAPQVDAGREVQAVEQIDATARALPGVEAVEAGYGGGFPEPSKKPLPR